jgi:apolipoprotein N-acyltransferase
VKTISWYPTGSDGVLKVVDTPWGRVGAAICFDMDTPGFARRLARLGAGLVLVPSYDSAGIKPYHSEVGLFRGIEGGYSVFRMVADGTSMAVDGLGVVRGYQDFFSTKDRVMLADLPVTREPSLYPLIGDLFAWLSALLTLGLSLAAIRRRPIEAHA